MRLVKRNLRPIWYSLYTGRQPVVGTDGNETGETEITYSDPVMLMCNISPASGMIQSEIFGRIEDYDKIIMTDQMDCPIDENSVLWIETCPIPDPEPEPDHEPEPESEPQAEEETEEETDPNAGDEGNDGDEGDGGDEGEQGTDPEPASDDEEEGLPPYEYIVRRVAKSLNHISYAISKVKVS